MSRITLAQDAVAKAEKQVMEAQAELVAAEAASVTYAVGDVFTVKLHSEYISGTRYLLTQVGNKQCCLVSLDKPSNRYKDGVKVKLPSEVTITELHLMIGSAKSFTKVCNIVDWAY